MNQCQKDYREQCSVRTDTEATERFTLIMDRFFDIFNVYKRFKEGKKKEYTRSFLLCK